MILSLEQWQRPVADTLLHFFWQGVFIALLIHWTFRLLANRTANTRYLVGLGGLCLMAVAPVITLTALMPRSDVPPLPVTTIAESREPASDRPIIAQGSATSQVTAPATFAVSQPAPSSDSFHLWVVELWCAGVLLFGMRLLLGFASQLRWSWPRAGLPEDLHAIVQRLASSLKMLLPRVYLSPRVPEALALGILRPIVLVPAAWLTEIPLPMLEAILAHELAHLRRYDLLVNLLQRVLETLLFYHPAVWWLSARVRQERELCCDALAVEVTGNRVLYAQTLERVARLAGNRAEWNGAIGVGGRPMNLLERVRLVLGAPATFKPRSGMAGFISIAAAAFLCWLALAPKPELTRAADDEPAMIGVVVDELGTPVSGITVRAAHERDILQQFVTDAKGRFQIPVCWRWQKEGMVLVAADAGRLGWVSFAKLTAVPRDKEFRLVMTRLNRPLEGILLDNQHNPLVDVPVVLEEIIHPGNGNLAILSNHEKLSLPATRTDRAGHYRLTIPDRSFAKLTVRHPDWVAVWISVGRELNQLGVARVPRAGRIEGRVLDARTGKPLAEAGVGAQRTDLLNFSWNNFGDANYGDAKTDRDGRFVIGGLLPGRYQMIFLDVAGSPKLVAGPLPSVTVSAEKAVTSDISVSEGRRLAGSVIYAVTGKPVSECCVGYYPGDRPATTGCRMTRTDDKGGFEFYVQPGPSFVYVAESSPFLGFPNYKRTVEVPVERDLTNVVLQLIRPVSGTISPPPSFGTDEPPFSGEMGRTVLRRDSVLISPEAGPYPPAIPAPDPIPAQPETRTPDPAHIAALRKNCSLRLDLQAPAGRSVTSVRYFGIRDRRFAYVEGQFSGSRLEEPWREEDEGQHMSLLIDAAGFGPVLTPEFTFAKGMKAMVIELQPAVYVPVRGRVLDAQGKPVPGARIRPGRVIALERVEFPWGVEVMTYEQGNFELTRQRLGERLFLYADKAGLGGVQSRRFSLEKDEPYRVPDLQIPAANLTLDGRVINNRDEPVEGAIVKAVTGAEGSSSGESIKSKTDKQGKFHFEGLLPGKVWLLAEAPGYSMAAPTSCVAGTLMVDVTLYPHPDPKAKHPTIVLDLKPKNGGAVSSTEWWLFEVGKVRTMSSVQNGNRITIYLDDIAIPKTGTTFKVQLFPSSFVSPKPLTIRSDQIDKPIAVELEPAAPVALTGRVIDEKDRPLEGVQVGRLRVLANGEVDEFWRWHFTGRDVSLPRTDSAGRFRIPDLLPGSTAAVYVNKQGYAGAESAKITLAAGTVGQLGDIRLPMSTRMVQGVVLDYRGKAVAGARVLMSDMSQSATTTDANGRFRFEKAQHGKLMLSIESEEHPVATKEIAEGVNEAKVWLQDPE